MMQRLLPRAPACAVFAALLLGFAPAMFAAKPAPAEEAQEDMEANLQKSLLGYKVGDPARYADLFAPLRTNRAALSPDGKFLAYTVREGDEVYLQVVAIDEPGIIKTNALIYRLEQGIRAPSETIESAPVRWLAWITSTRIAFATDRVYRLGLIDNRAASRRGAVTGTVFRHGDINAINADGSDARVLVRPDRLREVIYLSIKNPDIRALGLHPERDDSLIFAATTRERISRGWSYLHHSAYAVNVLTGERTLLGEKFTETSGRALVDGRGQVRITVDLRGVTEDREPLRYQPEEKPEGAPTLAAFTNIDSFVFSPATLLGERSVPLGFDASGNILYYASNVGRDTYGIYRFDLTTKQRMPGAIESPGLDLLSPQMETFDAALYYGLQETKNWNDWFYVPAWWPSPQIVTDRFTHELAGVRYEASTRTAAWFRPELQGVQEWLAANRPGRSAEILEWDRDLNRLLILEQGPADAGAYYVLDRQRATYTQFARRGAETGPGSIVQLASFDFKLADGSKIDGLIALPRDTKVKKIPLVLICPDQPWQHRGAEYLPEFEALTRMGFAVAIYNGRGSWGRGVREREKLKGNYDAMLATDLVAVADHLAGKFEVSRRSVALVGQGMGGYIALRTLQLHPDRFRCAVTVDAWLYRAPLYEAVIQGQPVKQSFFDYNRLDPTPVSKNPELIKVPVLTIADYTNQIRFFHNTNFHSAVKRTAPDSELVKVSLQTAMARAMQGEDRAQKLSRQWARTESFLNYVLYNFSVKIGELEVLPDAAKPKQR